MRAIPVGFVRRVVCASPRYLKKHGEPREPGDLARHTIVAASPVSPSVEWRFGAGKQSVTTKVRPRLSVTSNDAAIHAALLDFGVTRLMSYQVASASGRGSAEARARGLRTATAADPRHAPRGAAGVGEGARLRRPAGRAIARTGGTRLKQDRRRTTWRTPGGTQPLPAIGSFELGSIADRLRSPHSALKFVRTMSDGPYCRCHAVHTRDYLH